MNRNAKGAIAVGAATLLLLGGGGTFALWNASQQVAAGTVLSGELSLTNGTAAGWYDLAPFNAAHAAWAADEDPSWVSPADDAQIAAWEALEPVVDDYLIPANAIANINTYQVVPEAELMYVVNGFTITARGSDLFYTFGSDVDLDTAAADGYTVTVEPLGAADLPGTPAPASADQYAGVEAGTTVYSVNSTVAESETFNAGLRVAFDASGQLLFNSDLVLTNLNFVLQQVVVAAS